MTRRISLFTMVLLLVGAVTNNTEAQTFSLLPSPIIPSHRPSMKVGSKMKGAQPLSQQYNSGDPSQDEQYYLELLNRARMNPPAAGVEISNTTDPDVSSEFTYWASQDANEPTRATIKSDFATYQPKQPLAMNASLLTAARAHSQDMLTNNYQGHQGTDGSWPADRAQKAGYPSLFGGSPYVGENAAAYAKSVYDAYAAWLIDFGIPNDTQWGHRNNCLEFRGGSDTIDPGYTECGPGMIPNPGGGYPTSTGPLVSTLDLGDAGKHFILGVVYSDQNKNGLYDPGEGMSGVRIDVAGAAYYAVSATQGGYAVPYSGSGSVTVTASGPGFPTPVTKTIDFEGQNVKVDFTPDLTGYPTQPSLLFPVLGFGPAHVSSDSVSFLWNSVALATSYCIELATDSLLKQKLVNDSGLKDTTFTFGLLKDTTVYYWRVQAKNGKGVGPWSTTCIFSTRLTPSPVSLIAPPNNAMIPDTSVSFRWHIPDHGAGGYELQVATDRELTKLVWSTTYVYNGADTNESVPVDTFKAGQTYYWQVTAYNDIGWGRPSAVWSFTIASANVNPLAFQQASVAIAPNPTTGIIHLHYTLSAPEDVSYQLFNSIGVQVKSGDLGTRPAGTNEYEFDVSSLPRGTYLLELRINGRRELGRIVLDR